MKYRKEWNCKVLKKGNHEGYDYFILSLGTHPTAYVRIPKEHPFYGLDCDDVNIDCHWGLSFSSDDFMFNPIVLKDSWWIGWDYAHLGDYYGRYEDTSLKGGKKWTTEEIFEEVKNVIEQLKEDEQQ